MAALMPSRIAAAVLERMGRTTKDTRVAVQGYGNVGRFAALVCQELGMRVVAIGDVSGGVHNPAGLILDETTTVAGLRDGDAAEAISASAVLTVDCDLLIPAALGHVIHAGNAACAASTAAFASATFPTGHSEIASPMDGLKTGVRAVLDSIHSPPMKLRQGSSAVGIKLFSETGFAL